MAGFKNIQELGGVSEAVLQSGQKIYGEDGGVTDAYVISLDPAVTAYTAGMLINFKANTANTDAASLNVNGIGAVAIVKRGGTVLATNDIKAAQIVTVIYDGTSFQMQSQLGNAPAGGDMLAATYDPGAIAANVYSTDNHIDGTTNKVYTALEKTKLTGIEALADVTDAGNVGSSIHGATAKITPVDADTVGLIDSEAVNVLKKVTWANVKATLKTYFDTLYNNYVHPNHTGDVTSTGDGATVIANSAVTNTKMADMTTKTYKGRTAGTTGAPEDVAVATLKTDLSLVKGDVGLGNVDNTSNATERAATATLTNKRITPRVTTETSSATPTINTDNTDVHTITALAVDITSMTTNLSGTPTSEQKLIIKITTTATRLITWGTGFEDGEVALDTTIEGAVTKHYGFFYNSVTSKFRRVA